MHAAVTIKQLRWQSNSWLLIFFVCFFTLFICLGVWQLSRAESKRQWLAQRNNAERSNIEQITQLTTFSGKEFQPIALRGAFDQQTAWWLQNQTLNNQLGFDLLVPFNTESGQAILVNLGWQPNTDLSAWRNNTGQTIVIRGKVRKPMDLPFVSNIFNNENSSVVEIVPSHFPYKNLNQEWYLQIDPDQPQALTTHWQANTMTPAKHVGYAVQWFTMAAALLIVFILTTTNITTLWRRVDKRQV